MKRLFRFIIILFIFLFFVDFDVYANTSNDNTRIWIDYPKKNADISNSLKIQGWVMSKYEGTEIEVFIDQNKVDISRVENASPEELINNYINQIDIKITNASDAITFFKKLLKIRNKKMK